jgi:hypothetical protein
VERRSVAGRLERRAWPKRNRSETESGAKGADFIAGRAIRFPLLRSFGSPRFSIVSVPRRWRCERIANIEVCDRECVSTLEDREL